MIDVSKLIGDICLLSSPTDSVESILTLGDVVNLIARFQIDECGEDLISFSLLSKFDGFVIVVVLVAPVILSSLSGIFTSDSMNTTIIIIIGR